jgi:sirohydrochlorin cobaltochelatase
MVGRGSYEAEANAEMAKFARLRWESTPVGWHELCFTAMTRPLLYNALPKVAALGYPRVVVQPHLLFSGELLSRVSHEVAAFAASHPNQEYIVTGQLGVHALLAEAIVAKVVMATGAGQR